MQQVNLVRSVSRRELRLSVSYQNRKYHRDEGKFDDYFKLEFDPTKFDYEMLVKGVFEHYIECFQAYRGHVGDEEFVHLDFDGSRQVDVRTGVYRIYPVCFFDRELCDRCFRLTPEDIAKRVSEAVESVRIVSNGVLVVASSKVLTIEDANSISDTLKGLLAAK